MNLPIEPVARELLGEPNQHLSNPRELRYGNHGSLSVDLDRNVWFDHEQDVGGGVLDLIERRTGIARRAEQMQWLKERAIVAPPAAQKPQIEKAYDYADEHGEVLFQVVRMMPKDFRQRRPDGKGGWAWSVKGLRQVPYRLPALLAAPDAVVYVVEGEKDVDRLAALGLVATCNAGGAKKWRAEHAQYLAGRTVVILPDNDDAGREHAKMVLASLQGIADARIVELPGLPPKGDVSDWLDAGGTVEKLRAIKPSEAPPPTPKNDAAGLGLKMVEVVDVLEAPPPAPAYWIDELLPANVVTLLGAHGGTGKSMLALTAAVCLAAGLPFLGKPTRRARVVFYSGEDPALVLRWRLSLVCKHLEVDPRELEGWLAVIDATEGEPTLFYECTLDGRRVGLTTEVYGHLERIAKAGAEVFIIDNASDTFDADEINRARVRAFIRSLAMLTKPHAGAVLLLAHIDKTSARGFGGKEGYSGSTAWHNSVRSRLFLSESGDGLMLEQQKANLGRKANPMQLDRLEGGVLSLATVGTNPAAGLIASAHRDVVLGMFAEFYDRGEFLPVSQQAPGNAHKALSAERGFPPRMAKAEFWQLVRDAERAGYLVRENYQTKDRKERTRWGVTDSGRKVAGISPPAPTAPTLRQVEVSAPGASGAPTAPTSQGGYGGKMARTSRRKVGAPPPTDALPEPGEVGALA